MNETISTRRHRELTLKRERFYPRDRRTVPAARRFTREALADWGFAGHERADDVALCVSELATNALVHGVPPGRGYQLFLSYGGGVLRVEVHDSGAGVPRVGGGGGGGTGDGGRGLLLVAACADAWGVGERSPGKVVWASFEL
ncbi:ATP-binding protein [Streptomyces beihaiensis]|uniref:ATP-binding protein n=1 Tax=Streptomyces beihaiensis TaxID=2984495 RepID=A0ABT3TZ24_9ACTN|nr:ATP-binding protein [Streptomyces beihaiensis]MCX3061315.1 ATP-binding protein [Streptomyces beihaiensis]